MMNQDQNCDSLWGTSRKVRTKVFRVLGADLPKASTGMRKQGAMYLLEGVSSSARHLSGLRMMRTVRRRCVGPAHGTESRRFLYSVVAWLAVMLK